MTKRILVTGSAGFLGRHLCRLIKARGDEPLGLDLATDPQAPFLQVVGSVTDDAAWQTVGQIDGLIHAAAVTDLWQADDAVFEEVNTAGTLKAAQFAQSQGVPMVYVSSYTVLMRGDRSDERVLTGVEAGDPHLLVGPYARSKRWGEIEARGAYPPCVIVRPTAPIGPGDPTPTPPMAFLQGVAARRLPGVMRGRINVVDIRDVATATLAAWDRAGTDQAGDTYLLAGHDLTLKAFAAAVAGEAGVSPPRFEVPEAVAVMAAKLDEFRARRRGRAPTAPLAGVRLAALPVCFDASQAKRALGFEARPLAASIADALACLRQDAP